MFLVHRIYGLPDHLPLRRLHGTDLWYVVLELPEGSRVEYQLDVACGGQREQINDPLNPHLAHSPVGSSSVCYAHGHEIPDWTRPDADARPGSLVDMMVPSRALRRDATGHAVPAGQVPPCRPRNPLPAADRARRRRLPHLRGGQDRA